MKMCYKVKYRLNETRYQLEWVVGICSGFKANAGISCIEDNHAGIFIKILHADFCEKAPNCEI